MKITIDLDEEKLKDEIYRQLAAAYIREFSPERHQVDRIVAEQIRKIIYDDKDRIVEKIVARASRECGNKAVKKLAEMALKGGAENDG